LNPIVRIIKNSVFLSLATVVDRIAEFILFFFMARSLGPSFVGDYKTVIMYFNIFLNLANYGLTQLVVREVSTLRDRKETSALVMNFGFASLFIALSLMAVMNATGRIISYPYPITLGIYIVSFALLPGTWRRVAEAAIRGMESMEYIALVSFAGSVFRVVATAILLWQGQGLTAIFAVLAVTHFAVIPLYLYVIHRFIAPIRFHADFSYVKRMARRIGIFLVMGVLLVGTGNQLDVIMVRKMTSARQAGLYTAAYTFVQAIVLVRPAILQSVFPNMSLLFHVSLAKFQTLTTELLRLFAVILLPLPLVAFLLAEPLMSLLLGTRFADSATTFQALIWFVLPSFIYATLSRVLVAGNQERLNIRIAGVCMVTNVLSNLILIPLWGATGAAMASVLAITLAATYGHFIVRARMFSLSFREIYAKPVLCVLITAILAYLLQHVTLYVLVPLLLGFYAFLIIETKAIPARMMESLLGALKTEASRAASR